MSRGLQHAHPDHDVVIVFLSMRVHLRVVLVQGVTVVVWFVDGKPASDLVWGTEI